MKTISVQFLRLGGAGTEMIMNKTATIGYLSAGNRICSRVISDDFSGIARLLLPCRHFFTSIKTITRRS